MNSNCSNLLDMRNLQEQVKLSILLPKSVLTFNCLSKMFYLGISNILQILGLHCLQPRISKVFFLITRTFFSVGQNNFGNKIPFFYKHKVLNSEIKISLIPVLQWAVRSAGFSRCGCYQLPRLFPIVAKTAYRDHRSGAGLQKQTGTAA